MARYWEYAAKIVEKQAGQRPMTSQEISELMRDLVVSLYRIDKECTPEALKEMKFNTRPSYGEPIPDLDLDAPELTAAESIQDDFIICMECGQKSDELTETHLLRKHGLTETQYRVKHGFASATPLKAKKLTSFSALVEMSPKDAIQEDYIVCMECGEKMDKITRVHLTQHAMTVSQYRDKYGYSARVALRAKRLNPVKEDEKPKKKKKETPVNPLGNPGEVDWRTAFSKDAVICFECGRSLKVITAAHLRHHQLTPDEYKKKWGIPNEVSLMSEATKTVTAENLKK